MSQSIVASSDYIITRRTFRSLHISEIYSETEKRKRRIFDDVILNKIGHSVAKPTTSNTLACVHYFHGVDPNYVKLR